MKQKAALIGIAVLVLSVVLSVFTVDQTQQAIVIQLGKPLEGIYGPGLHFRVPFIQEVMYFEKRLLVYDASPTEVLTKDKKNLVIDNYAKWKIVDPLLFYKTVRNEAGAISRLDDIVYAQLRVELGQHNLSDIVSITRDEIMERVMTGSDKGINGYGIKLVDVRIKRADLPEQNENHVFDRMKAERERQAKQYRSEGSEEAQKITAIADMEKQIILAKAKKEAEITKGEGDAQAVKIYASAYRKDVEFFEYLRNLEAYKKALKEKTTLLMSPDMHFLKDLK